MIKLEIVFHREKVAVIMKMGDCFMFISEGKILGKRVGRYFLDFFIMVFLLCLFYTLLFSIFDINYFDKSSLCYFFLSTSFNGIFYAATAYMFFRIVEDLRILFFGGKSYQKDRDTFLTLLEEYKKAIFNEKEDGFWELYFSSKNSGDGSLKKEGVLKKLKSGLEEWFNGIF